MKRWTTPKDLRLEVQKLWDRGELLAAFVTDGGIFPKRFPLKSPTAAEMSDRFDEVRAWSSELRAMPHFRVVMREFRHRLLGANALPHEVWIDTTEAALALIGKQRLAARFHELIAATRRQQPELLLWLAKRPLRVLELADQWPLLLEVVSWVEKHPRSGVYLRQVDIPGVHTKFIEAHRGLLSELLDILLPIEAIEPAATGISRFASRYGFCDKPLRIRFRVLDPNSALLPSCAAADITLDAASFAKLDLKLSRVFITENEINFLSFPMIVDSMIIFGSGYGFEMLRRAEWLSSRHIYYWGDIDTHGFAILDQLRSSFDHVESLLMDRATLLAFEALWGVEEQQTRRDLPRLNREEMALYDDLRDNRLRSNLRLEQERIGFGWVERAVQDLRGDHQ